MATCDSNGVGTAVGPGSTNITAEWTVYQPQFDESGFYCYTIPVVWGFGASCDVKPRITSIDPSHGVAGTNQSVVISGLGLNGATIQAGSGVSVSINSSSPTQIQATFAIASNATNGLRSVTATTNSQISNPVNFLVQVPGSLATVSDTGTVQDFNCNAAFGIAYNGDRRDILYNLRDQSGSPIQTAGIPVAESFTPISNDCAVLDTPTPTSGVTDGLGNFPNVDRLALCSSRCLPANASGNPTGSCTLSIFQTWTANSVPVRRNQITYHCSSITVTPQ